MTKRPDPPPGYKFNFWGQLQFDPDYVPPPGFALKHNEMTNRFELRPLFGKGVDGLSDGNVQPTPNFQTGRGLGHVDESAIVIDRSKISPEYYAVEGLQSEGADRTTIPVPGAGKYDVKKRDAGIFG